MKPWLFVGAKVVCMSAEPLPGRIWLGTPPEVGAVYTVIAIGVGLLNPCVLWLQEIENNIGYNSCRFRPLIDTTSQVSAMRELMQKARDEKRVTVGA